MPPGGTKKTLNQSQVFRNRAVESPAIPETTLPSPNKSFILQFNNNDFYFKNFKMYKELNGSDNRFHV